MIFIDSCSSPVGEIFIEATSDHITHVTLNKREKTSPNGLTDRCVRELGEYFAGERNVFTLPLNASGTEFQKKCWNELCKIPFGKTISYGEQASRVGTPSYARAVGMANGKNPILILIPCHRVVAKDGGLGGFSAGLAAKVSFLEIEGCSLNLQLNLLI